MHGHNVQVYSIFLLIVLGYAPIFESAPLVDVQYCPLNYIQTIINSESYLFMQD